MLGHSMKLSNGKSVLLRPFTPFTGFKTQLSAVSSYVLTHHAAADRGQNHENNTIREAIICAIINGHVPAPYYLTERWRALKNAVDGFLVECGGNDYSRVKCIPKGGRGHHYDFSVVFTYCDATTGITTTKTFNVEFKFNAAKVSDAPQFVSPMKPSQYFLSGNYEESFYDKYMAKIVAAAGCVAPDRAEWLKQIHGDKPACVKELKDRYRAGSRKFRSTGLASDIAFHDLCSTLSKESIGTFITEHELDTSKLSDYLIKSQDKKLYMLFQPASVSSGVPTITLQSVDPADYTIASYKKNPELSRYDCITQSGKKMEVLLRWKNGNGIAFPAFQIS